MRELNKSSYVKVPSKNNAKLKQGRVDQLMHCEGHVLVLSRSFLHFRTGSRDLRKMGVQTGKKSNLSEMGKTGSQFRLG